MPVDQYGNEINPPTPGGDLPNDPGVVGQFYQQSISPEKIRISGKTDKTYWEAKEAGFYINPFAKFRATEKNAARLDLMTESGAGIVSTKYVFVNEISFGWKLNYESSQSVTGKTFYPRDVVYKYATIKGQTKSQYDYDLLVEWVKSTHVAALKSSVNVVKFSLPSRVHLVKGVGPEKEDKRVAKFNNVYFRGMIESITAGHNKKVFAPEFNLRFALLSYRDDWIIENGQIGVQDPALANRDFAIHLSLTAPDTIAQMTGYQQITPGTEIADQDDYGVVPPGGTGMNR